ncbi:MAG: hypothetical protein E2O37_02935 [Proteobacteria bacterium]|nr:MAG: hypothetical protein E2O37_02935 [Pseudomonadota bacterium]TDJ68845.1 MAG: hypothetical protein E2O38_14800 [Pseudomonadota bacterium]
MKRIRYIVLSAVIFAGGLAFGPASAALPSALPPFAADLDEGTIDRVDIKAGEIIIGDTYFVLAFSVRVYAFNGAPVSVKLLKKGMDIGYSTAQDASGQSAVANIVILSGN